MTVRVRTLAAAGLAAVIGAAGCGGGSDGAVELRAIGLEDLQGSAELRQEGSNVVGMIRVTGLEPLSAHAAHIHGVPGEHHGCEEERRTTNHLVNLPDVVADESGVAEMTINVRAPDGTIRDGTYLMLHTNPAASHHEGGAPTGSRRDPAAILAAYMPVDDSAGAADNPPIACAEFTDP